MSLRSFKEWKQINESQKSKLKCPKPRDKEFCKKWKLYLLGQGPDPHLEETPRVRIGPDTTRSSTMTTRKEKFKYPERGRGGRQGSNVRLGDD